MHVICVVSIAPLANCIPTMISGRIKCYLCKPLNAFAAVSAEMPSRIIITNLNFKKMNNLKLNKLNRISEEMKNAVRGGEEPQEECCTCGCCYVNQGGASFDDNLSKNFEDCLKTNCDSYEIVTEM